VFPNSQSCSRCHQAVFSLGMLCLPVVRVAAAFPVDAVFLNVLVRFEYLSLRQIANQVLWVYSISSKALLSCWVSL